MSRETRFEWKIDAMAVMLTRHHLLQSTTILRSTRCRKGGVRTKDLPFPYILLPHTPTSSILHPTKHLILQNRVSSPPPLPKPPPPIRQTYKEGGGGLFLTKFGGTRIRTTAVSSMRGRHIPTRPAAIAVDAFAG